MAVHSDKHELPVELTISALRPGSSNKSLFAAFVRDVTERKNVDDERERAKEAAEAGSRAKNGVIGMTDLVLGTDLTPDQRDCSRP